MKKKPVFLHACTAKKQFGSALQFYLQAAMVSTQFFEVPIRRLYGQTRSTSAVSRPVRSSVPTQAAILCQFLQPVDYATAYQALQEKRW